MSYVDSSIADSLDILFIIIVLQILSASSLTRSQSHKYFLSIILCLCSPLLYGVRQVVLLATMSHDLNL
jgi:hypothetical protein